MGDRFYSVDPDWRRSARQFAWRCRQNGEAGKKRFRAWLDEAAPADADAMIAAMVYWAASEVMSAADLDVALNELEPAPPLYFRSDVTDEELADPNGAVMRLRHKPWHNSKLMPDDSVWCEECGGTIAVADG